MLVKKIFKTLSLLLFLFFLFTGQAHTYDNLIVHPKLTREAITLHNQKFPQEKLSVKQGRWIVQGSIAEDTDPRYLNHFYNPKTGNGLNDGPFSGHSAKWWAYNQDSVSGDYSVPQILENYKDGNKKRAYQGVGHILHLIQDMTVPAHVRNDAHPEGDPFEDWLKKNNPISENNFKVKKINSLKEAFDFLANFTHDNFYSKDTLQDIELNKFKIVKDDFLGHRKEYLIHNKGYKLVTVDRSGVVPIYDIRDFKVYYDYWKQLHPKAIGYSAGVINYFEKEFKKIDKKQEKEKDLGFWQGLKIKTSEGVSDLWEGSKYILGDNVLATRKKVDNTYEAGKEKVDVTKKWTVLFSKSFAEVTVDGTKYIAGKTKDAWSWSKNKVVQGYDTLAIWKNKESEKENDKENQTEEKDKKEEKDQILASREESEKPKDKARAQESES